MYPTTERRKWVYPSQVTALATCGDSSDTGETEHFTFNVVKLKGCSEGTATISLKSWDGVRTYGTVDVEITDLPKATPPVLQGGAGYSSATIRWPAVDFASKYEVRHKEEGGEWSETTKKTENRYVTIPVTRNKKYIFQARSYGDGIRRSAVWGDWSADFRIRTYPPAAAHRLRGTVESATSIKATWTIPEGIALYEIEYKERDAETWTSLGNHLAKMGEVSQTIESLAPRLWSVRVRQLGDGKHSAGVYSDYVYAHDVNLLTPATKPATQTLECASETPAPADQETGSTPDGAIHTAKAQLIEATHTGGSLPHLDRCVIGVFTSQSNPGADQMSWSGKVFKRVKKLKSDFVVSDLDDLTTIGQFQALFAVRDAPAHSDTAADSGLSTSCSWCQGVGERVNRVTFSRGAYFRLEVAYALGSHSFLSNGELEHLMTETTWTGRMLTPSVRLERKLIEEFDQDVDLTTAQTMADWVLRMLGLRE